MTWHRWAMAALLAILVGRIVLTYRVFNDTIDESGHIEAGLEYLERGRYTFEAQHPPLARLVVAALPYYVGGLRLADGRSLWAGDWTKRDIEFYWRTLALARAGNLLFAVVVFFLVCRWSTLLYGQRAALAAAALVACCPNVIAHAALATLDIASAATVLLTAFFLWRWNERPGWRYALAAGAAFGLALLCKFSALGFVPPLAAAYFLLGQWKRGEWRSGLARIGAACALAGLIVWAGYRFETRPLVPPGEHYVSHFRPEQGATGLPRLLARLVEHRTMPAPRFWQGLIDLLNHNQRGHRAYLLGRRSEQGWWYYFPVAIAVKTTLPLLLLAGISVVTYRPRGALYLITGVVVVVAISMAGSVNIGIRHVLVIYPLLAILASAVFAQGQSRRRLKVAALILLGWHAAESVVAHPDYLPYFNQVARGREERFLADSNLDWGQDLARLGRWARERGIENFQISYFGFTHPGRMGVPHQSASCCRPEPGWIAVSVNQTLGIAAHPGWRPSGPPAARVGKSIWLYHIPSDDAARRAP